MTAMLLTLVTALSALVIFTPHLTWSSYALASLLLSLVIAYLAVPLIMTRTAPAGTHREVREP